MNDNTGVEVVARKKGLISLEDLKKVMDACYERAVDGIPKISSPVDELAIEYLDKYPTKEIAVRKMINAQIIKCTTSGFISGFGGLITLPVTVPANLSSVFYVQMRMIACAAYIGGYDLSDDEVQTLIYACLAGVSVNGLLKQAGIKVGQKVATNLIKKIPREIITKINQKIGFRFLTKFGEKGVINLGKLVPGVGAIINGGLDLAETKVLGNRAYKWFFMGDFSGDDGAEEVFTEDIIELPEQVEAVKVGSWSAD